VEERVKAIVVQPDMALLWTEVPDPVPGSGEVVVRVAATAVNRADLLQRRGKYPPPSGAPEWMGLEASGTIEELGEGVSRADWSVGDPVCCLLAGGGYAERVVVPASQVAPIPDGLDLITAAALPEVFATAYLNLYLEAGLREGETVLVHAAASGVGTAATQLARSFGSRVIATVGSPAKERFVRSLGAAEVIDRSVVDVDARLEHLGKTSPGIDVVLDCLGGDGLARLLPLLNAGGRWVVISLLEGGRIDLDLRPLLARRLRLIGSTLRSRPVEQKAVILNELRLRVWPLLERREVEPIVHAVFPIQEAEAAHGVLERRENIGKVLLQVDPGLSRTA
jgi:putative PIG3 family NAD(P)H quinone oxidoreductase